MAKKVFFNRHYKLPTWGQPYAAWGVVAAITLSILFFTSVESVSKISVKALPLRTGNAVEELFDSLKSKNAGEQHEAIESFAERLKKRHGYSKSISIVAECRALHLERGGAPHWRLNAALEDKHGESIFALLHFLERSAISHNKASFSATLLLPRKGCDVEKALAEPTLSEGLLPIFLDASPDAGMLTHYESIPNLRNLKLRSFFPSLFLTKERLLWTNILALTNDAHAAKSRQLRLPVEKWKADIDRTASQNILATHPALSSADAADISNPVALYLGESTQLTRTGFFFVCLLVWLLALIPFVNAIGTFREKLDWGPAATTSLLYALAFVGYFLLLKLLLRFTQNDGLVILLSFIMLFAVFFPVRVLQKTLLRATLNRAGMHLVIQGALTLCLFTAPGNALLALALLALLSGFARAEVSRKLLRLSILAVGFFLFWHFTKEPLGSFVNFLNSYIPTLSWATLPKILLLSIVCGNLTALFFIPRERN